MATIEGIFVKNYRVLKRIEFGKNNISFCCRTFNITYQQL